MNNYSQNQSRFTKVKGVALPLLLVLAGLYGQSALAGSQAVAQGSGVTVAGSTSTPTPAMSGMTSTIMSGGTNTRTTTIPDGSGGTSPATVITLPTNSVAPSFLAVGLVVPPIGQTVVYTGVNANYILSVDGQSLHLTIVNGGIKLPDNLAIPN